jgi:hypothetical protein
VRVHINSHVEFEGHHYSVPHALVGLALERLVAWGARIGVACAATVTRMLERQRHPEHAYRACLGLLNLSKR